MLIPLNTAFNRMVYLGATGLAPTVLVSKNGGSFAALAGSFSEISNGWYLMALSSSDTDTMGSLAYFFNAGSGLPDTWLDQVVDPSVLTGSGGGGGSDPWATDVSTGYSGNQAGAILFSNLDAPVSGALTAAGAPAALGLASANLDTQLAGILAGEISAAGVRAALGLASANLDTQLAGIVADIGTPLTAAGVRAALGLASANLDTQLAGIEALFPLNFSLFSIDTNGRGKIQSALPRNVATGPLAFRMYSASDRPEPTPGFTPLCEINKDGAGWNPCTNAAVDKGNGSFTLALTSSESNCQIAALRFTAPGAETTYLDLYFSA